MRKLILYTAFVLVCGTLAGQPSGTTDQFLSGVAEYSEGYYDQAAAKFGEILKKNPKDDAANYYLGLCEFATKKLDKAEAHFNTAVSIDSTNEWYFNALANLYTSKGDRRQAARVCEKLIKMNPGMYHNTYTLTLIGDAKYGQRLDSLAISYYNQALDMDPEYAPAQLGKIDVLRVMGNFPAFFVNLDNLIHNDNIAPAAKSSYLTELVNNIDSRFYWVWGEQINREVDSLIVMQPEDINSQMLKLRMYYIKNDMDGILKQCGIIETLAEAQGDNDNLAEAYSIEGEIYYKLGDKKKTFAAYDKALKVNPKYASVLNNYAYYLSLDNKSLRKALNMSKAAIQQEPDNATYLDTYGWILYLLNRPKDAKPYFKHAMIYGGKDSGVILEHYSKVLEALGEKDLATYYKSLSEQKKDK